MFTPKNQNNRSHQLENSKMFTFKTKNLNGLQLNIDLDINTNNPDKKEAIDNLENLEKQISPINNHLSFKIEGEGLKKIDNIEMGNEKRTENNDKQSQLFTQAIKDFNINSIEYSRFQDFVLSSQNNASLHFDVNNINLLLNADEEKDSFFKNNNPEEHLSTYKKKVISKFTKKGMTKIPSPIKENNEYVNEDFNMPSKAMKIEDIKNSINNRYNNIFGDVEPNTSRSGKSYYESHHRNKSKGKMDIEGDFTNLRNNSIITTEKIAKFNYAVNNEEDLSKKKHYSSNLKNLVNTISNNKENSKSYNFNSNLFIEEQKLRSSKEMNSIIYH